MSARRQARASVNVRPPAPDPDELPIPLALGCCVEVWDAPSSATGDRGPEAFDRALYRFGRVQRALAGGRWDEHETPRAEVWSLDGSARSPRRLRPIRLDAIDPDERLARAGVTRADVDELQAEADRLFTEALGGGSLSRAYMRHQAGAS